MTSFLVALQFLTRIPVKLKQKSTEKQTAQSLLFYPLIGLFIGLLLYSLNTVLFETNDMLRAVIILITWVSITGALHLDGLADSADALVGGFGDKEKTLAIMKDPYCGPVGVVSLVLILLLKLSMIFSITEQNNYLLILAPCLARSSILWSFISTPYVRNNGLGSTMAKHLSSQKAYISLATVGCISLIVFGWAGAIILLSSFLIVYLLKKIMMDRIGGMTGDTLGAQIEILEASILLTGLLFIGIQ